jgi:hypothetical protein
MSSCAAVKFSGPAPWSVFFFLDRGDPGSEFDVLRFHGGQTLTGLLRLSPPVLPALGEIGDAVLEALDGDLEVAVLALPTIAALAEEPDQGAGSAPVILGGRGLRRIGVAVHVEVLWSCVPEHPPSAKAQQKS